ncbi:hypothetical protein PS15p_209145 [Mucor circinelloides]
MGCCPSSLVDQGSLSRSGSSTNQNTNQMDGSNRDHPTFPRAYYNKSKPFKRAGLLWTADIPITHAELDHKRSAFWETAPSYGGREEIWQALRVAFEESDIIMARSILEAANIILPTGNPCEGCFDELGNEYEIPVYCVVSPVNLISEPDRRETTDDDQSSLAMSCTFLMKQSPSNYSNSTMDHQQLVPAPDCSTNPFTIVVRLSTEKDIPLTISSQNETVGSLRSRLFDCKQLKISNETHILRLVYLGRILQDRMAFVCSEQEVDIEKTFYKKNSILIDKDSIIQALVAIKE